MIGLLNWVEQIRRQRIKDKIAAKRAACTRCKGLGSITYGVGGGNGFYGYSQHQMPCPDCGYLEFEYRIGRSSLG